MADNPYAGGSDEAAAWQSGYEKGYADPEVEHEADVAAEFTEIFKEGEQVGRDERRNRPPESAPVQFDPGEYTSLGRTLYYGEDIDGYLSDLGIDPSELAADNPSDTPIV